MSGALRRISRMAAQVERTLPALHFGTMTFAWNQASSAVDDAVASTMIQKALAAGIIEIDTARIYSGGNTEPMLGRVMKSPEVAGKSFHVNSKAHPSQEKGLSTHGIKNQLQASLEALQVDKVDVYYLHQPDPETDLSESLACVDGLIKEGKIAKLGLSNFSAVEVARCCELCKNGGWIAPSFYQGLYNPLNRLVEDELLPVLRKNNISFIAFNPLAAGLLTGKHRPGADVLPGRFKDNPNYLPRFYTDAGFQAVEAIRKSCEEHDVNMVAATYAWMLRHSRLDATLGDGLLLGASSIEQLDQNLAACTDPPALPEKLLDIFNGAWSVCRDGAFPFWRSYSKDMPGRENLHPGASYNAAKTK